MDVRDRCVDVLESFGLGGQSGPGIADCLRRGLGDLAKLDAAAWEGDLRDARVERRDQREYGRKTDEQDHQLLRVGGVAALDGDDRA